MSSLKGWLALLYVGISLGLAACGGGGSEEKATSTTLTVESRELHAAVYRDDPTPALGTAFSFDSLPEDGLYFGVEQTHNGAVNSTGYYETGEFSGQLDLYLNPPYSLSVGTYTDTVIIHACYDESCRRPVQGSPATIQVTYEILAPPPTTQLTLDKTMLVAAAGPGGDAQTLSLLVTLDGPNAAETVVSTDFSRTAAESGINAVEVVRISDTQRRIDVYLADPDNLTPRQYSIGFNVSGCYGVACSRPAQSSASTYVLVNYRVHEFVEQTAQRVASGVSEMVWDPATQKFYLSFGSSVGTYANQVAMLDPVVGRITSSTFSGSEPRTLAVSDDGAYLYVGLGGANQVRRFRLPGLTLDATLELGLSANNGSRFANNISVAPGDSRTVAITFAENGLVIYDDTVARPETVDTESYNGVLGTISSITWGRDASVLYAAKNSSFIVFDVRSSGVAMNRSYDNALSTGWIRYFDGLIYTGNGAVLEPDTGSQVGIFQPNGGSVQALAPDTTAGRVYTISRHRSDSGVDGRLITFDAETYVPLRTLQLSLDNSGAKRLLRWGPDGLAMLTNSGDVYLLPGAARRE